ncbi:MAG: hypothetical protein IJN65_02315 [Clostridia bacterium]|nr:hypothetical protein [Clostridia bacterium]
MLTQKLFETDSYIREFTATVLSCTKNGENYDVILDKTAFFAEGGGQKADTGTIDSVTVLDVQETEGEIIHKTDAPLMENTTVTGKIDWDIRFARMQSHTGEHIVSGVAHSLFGVNNIGFHMSENLLMTVDFDKPLSKDDIKKIELLSNQKIYQNYEVTAYYPTADELKTLDYRSKLDIKSGVRIVNIEGTDSCACCAPHVSATGEVGLIKIIDFYPNKQGVRIEMLAGLPALEDYITLNNQNKQIMGLLCAKREDIVSAVTEQSNALNTARSENTRLSRELALSQLNPEKINDSAYAVLENKNFEELRYCSNTLIEKFNICALFSTADDNTVMYVLSSKNSDVLPIVKELNSAFNGKGGGKPNYAQGKLTVENLPDLTEKIKEML